MRERTSARALLERAIAIYDTNPGLEADAYTAARTGFSGGLHFLCRHAGTCAREVNGHHIGIAKYGACIVFAIGVSALTAWLLHDEHFVLVPLAAFVLAFYGLESRLVFVFPAAAHGDAHPFATSWRLTRHERALGVVLPLASFMLFGPLFGQGLVRSWTTGCLAVSLWYRDVRGGS